MKREVLLFLTLICILAFSNNALAQIPPTPPGCPGDFVAYDGNYWIYENVLCIADIFTGQCTPTPTIPATYLAYSAECANTNPPCAAGGACGACNSNCTPVDPGGGGPLTFKTNGSKPTTQKGAKVKEFEEFVAKDSSGVWYKFSGGKMEHDGNTKVFNYCFKVDGTPVKCGDAGVDPGKCTPSEWFIDEKINFVKTLGSTKKVEIGFKNNILKTYSIVYPRSSTSKSGGGTPTPAPAPETSTQQTSETNQ